MPLGHILSNTKDMTMLFHEIFWWILFFKKVPAFQNNINIYNIYVVKHDIWFKK